MEYRVPIGGDAGILVVMVCITKLSWRRFKFICFSFNDSTVEGKETIPRASLPWVIILQARRVCPLDVMTL